MRRGWRVFGVDPSTEACELARRRGLEVFCGRLRDVPWEDGSFDAVVFTDSLEHTETPAADLEKAATLLRNDGVLAVTVPNFGSWQRKLFGTFWFHLDLPRHLQHFDERTLGDLVRRAGLAPIEIRTSSMALGLPGSVQYVVFGRCVVRRGLRVALMASMLIYPLVRIADRAGSGDRLHLLALRSEGA